MIGVAAAGPGKSATHFTFSVFEKRVGNPFSVVEPLKNGPRHCDQFSAPREREEPMTRPPSANARKNFFLPMFILLSPAPAMDSRR